MQIANILSSLFSIFDRVSQYLYEKRLIKQGYDRAVYDALLKAREAEEAADRELNPSIINKLRKRYARK